MKKIRVYGPTIGNGSFAVVTRGIVGALKELDLFAGLVPTDDVADPDAAYDGFDAPIGLLIGPPQRSTLLVSAGDHVERLLMLVPNSTWLPREAVKLALDNVTGFVTPSAWAKAQILAHLKHEQEKTVPVYLWTHGVDAAFTPDSAAHDGLCRRFHEGYFHVVHLTSTAFERKGTRELLAAWKILVEGLGWTTTHHTLTIVAETLDAFRRDDVQGVNWTARKNLDAPHMAALLQSFHAVVQPSRGEGFGLIPLEARMCGIPTVVTRCTGHTEHVPSRQVSSIQVAEDSRGAVTVEQPQDSRGVVTVEQLTDAALMPIDDGPGARAPDLSVDAIVDALRAVKHDWVLLERNAFRYAKYLPDFWSWAVSTRAFIDDYMGAGELGAEPDAL